MSEDIKLTAKDGVTINAYLATPTGTPKGAMVVLQEIFGVNHHIRNVADRYAAEGYLTIAPALFDRVEEGVSIGYGPDDMQRGIEVRAKTDLDATLLDIEAAIARVAHAGKVGIVGYCWGGSLVYVAASRLSGITAGVGYYGGMIAGMLNETPKIPTMLHFGALDKHIPLSDVEKIQAAKPQVPVYVYDADHGFNCDERGSYNEAAANIARERTLKFFDEHLAK